MNRYRQDSLHWQLASTTALPAYSTSRRLYFFTEALPDGARNVHHIYAQVAKLGVILEGDAAWEQDAHTMSFCGTILRLDDGRLRLYYTTSDARRMRLAVAESDDGLVWQRPSLGQEIWHGHDTNRIVLTGVPEAGDGEPVTFDGRETTLEGTRSRQGRVAQPQVLRLLDGRWRMVYWHHQQGWGRIPYYYTVAESNDGLRWHVPNYDQPALTATVLGDQSGLSETQRLMEKARRTNDANYVYWNPWLQCYEQFSQWFLPAHPDRRVDEDNCPMFNRMIQRRLSADGLTWCAPELVIQADEHDPWDQQFYSLAVQYHEDWLVGSLGHYRVEKEQQTMDLALAFSRDGRHWERPVRGGFIPRDPDGRDSEGAYAPNAWIDQGDRWLCLYSGTARKHNRHHDATGSPNCIMGATWAKHRFVGLRADSVPGGFMTPVFFPQSAEICVDAEVRGWLRAELCDAWGRKLEGFHLSDSATIRGDDSAHVLRWKQRDTACMIHDAVRVRFEFADATVYSVAHAMA
jgi:hypothetical protein